MLDPSGLSTSGIQQVVPVIKLWVTITAVVKEVLTNLKVGNGGPQQAINLVGSYINLYKS